jgi:hypothetical protein
MIYAYKEMLEGYVKHVIFLMLENKVILQCLLPIDAGIVTSKK